MRLFRLVLVLTGCLLLLCFPAAAPAQKTKDKDKEEEKRFSGKTIAEWIKELASEDVGERRMAAMVLNKAGASAHPAVKALARALDDKDNLVKFYCLQALGNLGTSARSAIPAVVKLLRAGEPTLARSAAGTLGKMGKDAVEPLCQVLLEDENPQVRRLSAVALALIGTQASSAAKALAKALFDDSFRVRRVAADALRLIEPDPKDVLDALVKALRDDRDADVCRGAAIALGKLGKPALKPLVEMLGDKNADLRYNATIALREMGGDAEPAVKPLILALRDKDEDVRASAAVALGAVGEPAVGVLIESLGEKDAGIRRGAAIGLGQVGPKAKKAVPALIKAAQDDDAGARGEAIRALGMIGDKDAVKPLMSQLSAKDADTRRLAAGALGEIGVESGPAAETLVRLLEDEERSVRETATVALLRIGKPSVEPLEKSLKDRKRATEARVLALVALGAIGEDSAPAAQTTAEQLKDKDASVRLYAAMALGRMGPKAKSAEKALREATKDDDPSVAEAAEQALERLTGKKE